MVDTLPFSEKTSSGTSVECGFINVPLHNIDLSSDLATGLVAVGIRHSLPLKGVHLLLGNDLAGDKVVVDPLLTNTPCVGQPPDHIEQENPDLYPSCAVTRTMAKKANQYHGNQTDFDTSRSYTDLSSEISNNQGHDKLSRSQLCKEQHSDSEIPSLFDRALDDN